MLTIKDRAENLIRFTNGNYLILASLKPETGRVQYTAFKEKDSPIKGFLPEILIDNWREDGAVDIRIMNSVSGFPDRIDNAILRFNHYLNCYKITQQTIEEIQQKIESGYFEKMLREDEDNQ